NRLHAGSGVNLERAMQVNDRFGGHFISGHVDGVGTITKKEKEENAVYYNIKAEKNASALLMKKGSIAVDGISLTVFDVQEETFTVSLIPHTTAVTTLGNKKMGDIV